MVKNPEPTPQAREFAVSAVTNYGLQLHHFLRRRVRHVEDLDDMVQEVYLRLLRVKNGEARHRCATR
ncbi:MAG TPA: sigma factor [Deinococcales bacterium]|nr:sigma factor [Deinococcales bacterium]